MLWTCKSRKRSRNKIPSLLQTNINQLFRNKKSFIWWYLLTVVQFKKIAEVSSNDQFTPGKYIACVYDDECYIALIHKYSHENCDVRVQFMKRNGLLLYWFEEDNRNQCWIPLQHTISVVQVPTLHGSSARNYYITLFEWIIGLWKGYQKQKTLYGGQFSERGPIFGWLYLGNGKQLEAQIFWIFIS